MSESGQSPPSLGGMQRFRRRSLSGAGRELVGVRPPAADEGLPLVLEPAVEEVDPAGWAAAHRDHLDRLLAERGALLFRGFGVTTPERFAALAAAVAGPPMDYEDRTSPRSAVAGRVFTSTDYPADQPIRLHNENSYSHRWPLRICFCCLTPAEEGGATPLADSRRVLARLPAELVRRFDDRGVMYLRNFGDGLGLPWREVFGSDDRGAVEEYCRKAEIAFEWRDGDRLGTCQVRPAVARHPVTGEAVWFNQVPLFHVAALEPEVRRQLLASCGEEGLPNHARYGDGSPIADAEVEAIIAAYDAETRAFSWRRGDVVVVDNMLVAHGRAPFRGERRVVVAMAEPCGWERVSGGGGSA